MRDYPFSFDQLDEFSNSDPYNEVPAHLKELEHSLNILRATASQTAILACQDAVLSRAPFGEWTSDMLARLGGETVVRFSFYYR